MDFLGQRFGPWIPGIVLDYIFSNQIVYEAPKTDDQNEIRFVKLEDEEYNLLRNKMLRNIAPKLSSGHSWMSRDCPRPFSEI